jgi:hypothetical protein
MNKIILILCAISSFMIAQDAAGQYKLSGVHVEYTYVSRSETVLTVTDAYGLGITQGIATIPAAAPFTTQSMQLTDAALAAIGINLNVTLNEDASGSIAEGSYYPDVNTIEGENGECVTLQQVLPVTDEFTYTSDATLGLSAGGVNALGLPGISVASGLGGLGLSGSLTFEDYPMVPSHPTICDPTGTDCFPFTTGDADSSGTLEIYPDLNLAGFSEYVPGGAPLTGISGGFWKKVGVNGVTPFESIWGPTNTAPDFYLEWHGVDGSSSGLGWGDLEDADEDADGTWFDREIGIPAVTASYMNPACGFTQPIWGDLTGSAYDDAGCLDYVDVATSGLLLDPSGSLATWGNFLTANAAGYSGCLQSGADTATCGGLYGANDSDHDFDGTTGRLTMNFDIPCVGVIEGREVIAEFIEVGGGECGTGDMNSDGGVNVLDVVALVNAVLTGSGGDSCVGDMNADGGTNVLDVVALVNTVLTGGRLDGATSAEFNMIGNEVTMTADGYVGAVQMTLSHGNDFTITLTNDALVADYLTTGNTTTLMIVNPNSSSLFSANSEFSIESVVAASNSDDYMSTKVNVPSDYTIDAAYPNPFNPTTQMSLTLNTAADISVNVFNMNGQLIDVLANGQMSSGSYSFTWDGTNASSGVYFIKTQVGSEIHSQKIMLVK